MQRKLHIKKGDKVQVIAGIAKGQDGVVLVIDKKKDRAIVEGLTAKKIQHVKPQADKNNPDGGRIEKDLSIHISNLMILDGKGNPTRIGRKADEDGKLVRYAKTTGEVIS
ncbi:MAG: 50S ribosomal protein L24 [Flavobacteriales bacterium]|nr:50S ribosomal protein L24 [Flavobacteriales bacterium]